MNLTGKILTGLIAVMSIAFMFLAVAVYAAHKDWYGALMRTEQETQGGRLPLGYKPLLDQEREKNTALKEQLAHVQEAKDAVESERKSVLAALANEKDARQKEQQLRAAEIEKLSKQYEELKGQIVQNEDLLQKATKEVEVLRGDIRSTQKERDDTFDKIVKITEEIHQTIGELGRQKERNEQLARQAARNKLIFDQLNINPDNPPGALPPALRGKVLAVNKEKMIEVSLGSDDGLQVGHKLEVFRGAKWLGKAEILRVETDRAVAKILPGYQKGPIQKDDDVATRLKNDLAAGVRVQ